MTTATNRTGEERVRAVMEGHATPEEQVEAAEAAYLRHEHGAHPLNAFLSVDFRAARERAREVADQLASAERAMLLAGAPVALKDNLSTLDHPTTCGSRLLADYHPPFDATVVRRVREAGGVVVGKTNLDELGMGSSTEHSAFGPTRNPHDPSRVAGGSSGGSAAAVAAGIVPFALGSDTGGSVRQPAALCGVVGIRPTYGAVSRYGLVGFAPSMDQVGAFGRTVGDAALLLETVMGHDPRDATSARREVPDLRAALGQGIEGVRIGVAEELFPDTVDRGVREAVRAALRALESLGAEIREVSLPHAPLAVPAYTVLAAAEASSNLARFDGVRFGARAPDVRSFRELVERTRAAFGAEVKRRVVLGAHLLSAPDADSLHERARLVRALVLRDLRWVFASGVDAVFCPTTPAPAWRIGEGGDPFREALSDAFTAPASLAGLPALSLPIGTAGGLPVGGQLVGDAWSEARLVRIADALERALAPRADAAAPAV